MSQRGSSPVRHAVTEAAGPWIRDDHGRWLYDLHGNSCHQLGYRHPRLVAAAIEQLTTLPFAPRRFTCEPAVELAEGLLARWPGGDGRVLFSPTGSTAIEIAMKIARIATGRPGVLAFHGAWHGAGFGALSAGGRTAEKTPLEPLLPYMLQCEGPPAWCAGQGQEEGARASLSAIEEALATRAIGCLLAEPVTPGLAAPPVWFWPQVKRLCADVGTLLVFDEIARGWCWLGTLFTSARYAVAPDILVLGKGLGGAMAPLAATIACADLDVGGHLAIGHVTHEKSALGCRIALEALRVLETEGLCDKADAIGARLADGLSGTPGFAEVQAIGALSGMTLASELSGARLEDAAYSQGINLVSGRDRLVLTPPLILTDADVDDIIQRMHRAAAEVVAARWL